MTTENQNAQTDPDWNGNDDGGSEGMVPRSQIRNLEQKAKGADDANARAQAAERELAFVRAGVDTDTKAGQYFLNGYDGELTPEAIKAEADEVGLFSRQSDTGDGEPGDGESNDGGQEAQVTDEERQFDQHTSDASSGSPGDEQPEVDPHAEANQIADQALEKGAPRDQALGAAVATLGNAAVNGDSRALWTPSQG